MITILFLSFPEIPTGLLIGLTMIVAKACLIVWSEKEEAQR